jgi:hypothetical protein
VARALVRGVCAVALVASLLVAGPVPAPAASGPYTHVWRIQREVGGDRGGRSQDTVLDSSMSLRADGAVYTGKVAYSDRLVVEDAAGGILVQVSYIDLALGGGPAGSGAVGGSFTGTARLDDYLGLAWADAVAGRLPAAPSRSATYDVRGSWGALLTGGTAAGELLYESALVSASAGAADVRDASWFDRFGSARAQTFVVEADNVATPAGSGGSAGGTGSGGSTGTRGSQTTGGTGVVGYILRGLTGEPVRPPVAVPALLASAARALREARPSGAAALPAGAIGIDLDVAGNVLDAKNRAAGLTSGLPASTRARRAWTGARSAAPVSTEPTATELSRLLSGSKALGAEELAAQVTPAAATRGGDYDALLSEWLFTARAPAGSLPSVLAATAEVARTVATTAVPRTGPAADALLAEADSIDAPVDALRVTRFARVATDDFAEGRGGSAILREVLGAAEKADGRPVLEWTSARGAERVVPKTWPAYRRADGLSYWLAGPGGPAAVRDGTLAGWAFTSRRLYVADAYRVGELQAVLPAAPGSASTGE